MFARNTRVAIPLVRMVSTLALKLPCLLIVGCQPAIENVATNRQALPKRSCNHARKRFERHACLERQNAGKPYNRYGRRLLMAYVAMGQGFSELGDAGISDARALKIQRTKLFQSLQMAQARVGYPRAPQVKRFQSG